MTTKNNWSEFIKWVGGECPVHPMALVEVRWRDFSARTSTAKRFDWGRARDGGGLLPEHEIVEYRVAASDVELLNAIE